MNQIAPIVTTVARWFFYAIGTLLGVAVLLVLFIGFTGPGARLAASVIEKLASTPDQIVSINDPAGLLTGNLTAGTITLNDSKGIYAEIRELSVSWSPLDLIDRSFSAKNVTAGTVRLERLPIPSQQTEEVRSAFALPVDIHIDALQIDELVIGKAITGQDQFLKVSGSVDATNESIALKLDASERDRPEAIVKADIVFDPSANTLKLNAKIDEPKGGMLAKLLRLPNEPAVGITIDGTGPLSDWTGKATAALDGTQRLVLDATHKRAADGVQSVTLSGGGDFAALMPPALRPLFAGTAAIDLDAAFLGSQWLRVNTGKVSTAAFTLTAAGTASTSGENNLQASLSGTSGAIDFRWPLAAGEAKALINTVNLSLIGEAQAAILDIAADIASVTLPQGQIDAVKLSAYSDAFDLANRGGTLKTSVETGATQLADANLERLIKGPLKLNGTVAVSPDAIRFDPLTLESASIGGTVNGSYALGTNAGDTASTAGALEAAFKLFALPGVLPPALAEKFDTTIALAGTMRRSTEGRIDIEGFNVTSGTVTAAGSFSLDDGTLASDLKGTLPDIGKLLADAQGAAAFDVAVSGTLDSPAVKATLTSSGATLAGRTLGDLVVNADATIPSSGPQAKLTATGTLSGQAININADVVSTNGSTSIPVLQAQIGENRLNGALTLTPDFKPTGDVAFTFPDIGLLAAMAGQTASGDLSGTIGINTTDGVTSLAVKAAGSGIQRGDLSIVKPMANLTVADLATFSANGRISADSVTQGANSVSGLGLDFDRNGPTTAFKLRGNYDGAPLTADGAVETADGRTTVRLAALSATPRKIPLTLTQPVSLTVENGKVALDTITINASGGTIALSGSAGETLDLSVRLTALPAALINTFSPTLGADGKIDGTLTVTGVSSAPTIVSDVTWSETGGPRLADANLNRLLQGPLKLTGTVTVTPDAIRFNPVTLASDGINGTVTGALGTSADSGLQAAFKLSAMPDVLPPVLSGKFDGPIAVAGTLRRSTDGRIDVEGLDVASGTITAAGTFSLDNGALTSTLKGTLPDIGKLLADAKGAAAFDLAVSGTLDAPAVKATVTSSGATLAGRTLSDLIVNADATIPSTGPQASLTATGALSGQAINIKADVVSKDGGTSIPVLQAQIGDNRLNGTMTLTPDFKPTGDVTFTFPDIGLLAAMAGQTASGDLTGTIGIKTMDGITSLAVKASGSGIKRGDLSIVKPVADLTVADLATFSANGKISAESVAQGVNRVTGLGLDFDRSGAKTTFKLRGNYDGAPLSADGDVESADGRTTVRLAALSATPRKIPLKLGQPVALTIENGNVAINGLTIGASGGTIAVSGSAGETLDLTVRLNALPAALINTFSPSLGAEGRIGGTLTVTGTPAAPNVVYDLTWSGAALTQTKSNGLSAFDVTAKGRFADNRVTLDTVLSGGGGLSFRGGGSLGVTGSMPAEMKFNGTLPFAVINGLLAEQGFQLTGSATVDIAISGAITAPQITGSVSTSGARFLDVRRNLAIEGLSARVTLSGNQATIASLTGNLSTGGTLSVGGTIGTAPGSGFPANLTITLKNLTYVDGALLTASANGALTVTGPLLSGPVLGGRVNISKAAITIPQKLPASLSEINITHKNASRAVKRMTSDLKQDTGGDAAGSDRGGGIAFNLVVDAPSKIFVRGRGIDAELGGRLTITGSAANPSISGGFKMRRGRLEILGKRLDFSDGTISFGGGLVPTLNLDATSTAGSTTVTVNVAGPANNPAVTFSSSPALPQDEILAQLIFNRSLSNLSALQIAQLASAVSTLAGGKSTSLLDGLRNKLGVDDLDITTDESGGASVRAGKYLNDRTYIELQSGSEAGGGKAIINLDVGRGIKLRGEAGSDGSAAGIFYEKEY